MFIALSLREFLKENEVSTSFNILQLRINEVESVVKDKGDRKETRCHHTMDSLFQLKRRLGILLLLFKHLV